MLFFNKGTLFINKELSLFITDISFVTNGGKIIPTLGLKDSLLGTKTLPRREKGCSICKENGSAICD